MPLILPAELQFIDGREELTDDERQVREILLRVSRGDVTPSDAEDWAKERQLPAFTGRPHPSIFDPISCHSWTPLQAVVWIATRDVEEVRNVSTEFRRHWRVWRGPWVSKTEGEQEKPPAGWFIDHLHPASFLTWPYLEAGVVDQSAPSPGRPHRKPEQADRARAEFWAALSDGGNIHATGLMIGDRHRSDIPAIEWSDLTFALDAPDNLHNRRGLEYQNVLMPSKEVLGFAFEKTLLDEAHRSHGVVKQPLAFAIAAQHGKTDDEAIEALKRLEIGDRRGRPKKASK